MPIYPKNGIYLSLPSSGLILSLFLLLCFSDFNTHNKLLTQKIEVKIKHFTQVAEGRSTRDTVQSPYDYRVKFHPSL